MRVGGVYTIQPITADLGPVKLKQDTVVEVQKIERGKVTFISSEDLKYYTVATMALKMVI